MLVVPLLLATTAGAQPRKCNPGNDTECCGDGKVDDGEQCDLGKDLNGDRGTCCTEVCLLKASGTACTADSNPCSLDECDGAHPTCRHPPGNAGAECRAAAGPCDVAETCNGTSSTCPDDAFLSADTPCRPAAGECDLAETCPGDGPDCPDDAMEPAGTACTADDNPCTLDECDGTNATCQHPAGNAEVECRAAAGPCDVAETCTGTSTACPADAFLSSDTPCRPAAGECDLAETCPGNGPDCPADAKKASGTACTADDNPCTLDECDGTNVTCQHPAGNAGGECRAAAGPCDVAETCTGTSTVCPADAFRSSGAVCRPAADLCDVPESCTGSGPSCPADARVVCTPQDQCHVAGTCDPTTGRCSNPAAEDGRSCDDGNVCTTGDECKAGVCRGTLVHGCCVQDRDCEDGIHCTVDRCSPQGCVHAPQDDLCGPAECAVLECEPNAPDADASGCVVRSLAESGYCAEDNDPCTIDSCRTGQCTHVPDDSGPRCARLVTPFQSVLGLLARAGTLRAVVGEAAANACPGAGARPPACDIAPGPDPGRLMSLLDTTRTDLATVLLALGGRLPGVALEPMARARFAFFLLANTPGDLRAFIGTLAQMRARHEVAGAFARQRRADGKRLLRGVVRLRAQLRRLAATRHVFTR